MAGVAEVTYHHVSSTEGWWEGQTPDDDTVQISESNAKTIYKDCQQGFTDVTGSDLNDNKKAAAIKLNQLVNPDDVEYTDEEQRNVGRNQVDTEDAHQNKSGENWAGVGSVGSGASITALCVAAMICDGFSSVAIGWTILGLCAANLGMAFGMKSMGIQKRLESEDAAAETNNTTFDNYNDMMATAMQTMTEEQEQYQTLSNEKFNGMMGSLDEITALRAELETYRSQGNMEKVNEIQAKIDELTASDGENQDQYDTQMDPLRENLETYSGNVNEAFGVHDSGTEISEFLDKSGKHLRNINIANVILSGVNTVLIAGAALGLFPKLAPLFPDISGTITAKIVMFAAAAMEGTATKIYFDLEQKDNFAQITGNDMKDNHLNQLAENAEGAAAFIEETSGFYDGVDGESGEAYGEATEGADEAVENTVNGGGDGGDDGEDDKGDEAA